MAKNVEKKKKKKHPLKTFFSLVIIFVSCFLIWVAGTDLIATMKLKKEISSSEQMITNLEDQQNSLASDKSNLENPEYVQRFARGKYMVCKPGEQVFKLPSKNDDK